MRPALRLCRTVTQPATSYRYFSATPPARKDKPVVDDVEDKTPVNMKVQTIIAEDPQNAFKHKIMTEIIKDEQLEEPETVQTNSRAEKVADGQKILTPVEPVPEKDEAFKEKKTTLWQKIKVVLVHLKHSFIDIWKDTKYILRVIKKNGFDEENYSLKQMQDRRRISMDLVKFVPYGILILLPGGELLFPPYFMLFPNSTPTQFLTANSLGERKKHLAEKQNEGYNLFVKSLPKFGHVLGIDSVKLFESLSYIQNTEGKEKDRQIYKAQDFEEKIRSLLENPNRKQFEDLLNLGKLSSYELEQLCKIFYFEYVPGTVWVNLVYGIFFKFPFWTAKMVAKLMKSPKYSRFTNNPFYKFKFTLDNGPLSYLKKQLLVNQLRFHIRQLRKQDRVLSKNSQELATIPQMQRVDFARQRAIRIEPNAEIVRYVENFWLPLSQRRDIPDDMLVWIAVLRYKYTNIMV